MELHYLTECNISLLKTRRVNVYMQCKYKYYYLLVIPKILHDFPM